MIENQKYVENKVNLLTLPLLLNRSPLFNYCFSIGFIRDKLRFGVTFPDWPFANTDYISIDHYKNHTTYVL